MTDPLTRVPGIWRAGLLTLQHGVPARLVGQDKQGRWNAWDDSGVWLRYSVMDGIEVATGDPTGATTGCLAAFCRELYGAPLAYAMPDVGAWSIWLRADGDAGWSQVGIGPTEAAAWKAAILAHPSLSELR